MLETLTQPIMTIILTLCAPGMIEHAPLAEIRNVPLGFLETYFTHTEKITLVHSHWHFFLHPSDDTGVDAKYPPVGPPASISTHSHQHHPTWDSTVAATLDDPEHRLSSASFPESAISLTDSVYSTAGSTSLSSYIDATSLSDSSSAVGAAARPTMLTDHGCGGGAAADGGGGDGKDEPGGPRVLFGKPRYHSDPMTVAGGPHLHPTTGIIATQSASISEPILLPPAVKASDQNAASVRSPPHMLKEVILRESGGQFFGVFDGATGRGVSDKVSGGMAKAVGMEIGSVSGVDPFFLEKTFGNFLLHFLNAYSAKNLNVNFTPPPPYSTLKPELLGYWIR